MARTAKKKIAIKDEGITLTDDVDSLDFIGSGVSAALLGDEVDITINGGGAGFTKLPATGAVNGNNRDFTFTEEPDYIVSDNVWMEKLDSNSVANWTWNGGTLTATMAIPPSSAIYGFT